MLSLRKKVELKTPHARKQHMQSTSHLEDGNSSGSEPATNSASLVDTRIISATGGQDQKVFNDLDQNTFTDIDNTFSVFTVIFEQLKSPNAEEKKIAYNELEASLLSISRELSAEQFQRFSNTLNNKIFELMHGSTPNEKIGGILAVDVLISLYSHTDELPNQTARLANYLRMLIPTSDIEVMRLAAETLGKLAVPGSTLTSDFVELEAKTSLEWLSSLPENNTSVKQEYKKHAALLILSALGENSPYLLYPFVDSILENIWRALRDNKLVIRVDAANLLGKCLNVLKQRNIDNSNEQWVSRLYGGCIQGLQMNTIESIHATLLVYRELLSLDTDKFLKAKITDVFQNCMLLKDHKVDVIRLEVYRILPLLASFDRDRFVEKYLDVIMAHYLSTLKSMHITSSIGSDKASIFVSMGEIAARTGPKIEVYIDPILENVRDGFKSKFKVRKHYEKELFFCVSQLSVAVGPALAKYLTKDILNYIFSCILSDYMEEALSTIMEKIPALKPIISKRLLTLLSYYLSGAKFDHYKIEKAQSPFSLDKARNWRTRHVFNKNDEPKDETKDVRLVAQALRMINKLQYGGPLKHFACFVTIAYIEFENPVVRKLAALTTCELFSRDTKSYTIGVKELRAVSETLTKLLMIAITDPVADIRLQTIQHLSGCFDAQLCQPDNLRLISLALKDEMFSIQKETLLLLGRLSRLNSMYLVPALRRTLLELLTELEHATWPRKKEECIVLMQLVISSNEDVSRPYLKPILDMLLTKTKDSFSTVSCTAIQAIGELSVVAGNDMQPYLNQLMSLIIDIFQDQPHSFKTKVALKTLGQLASSCGYVIRPLLDYPELLGILLRLLKPDNDFDTRRETLRLLGILGALDPYKHREVEVTSRSKTTAGQTTPFMDIALLMQGMSPSNENYCPKVVLHSLTNILDDNSYATHHTAVVQSMMHILQNMGLRGVSFLSEVVPAITSVMKTCPPSFLEFYFQQIIVLVSLSQEHINTEVISIFEVIKEFFPIVNLQNTITSTIEAISKAIGPDFRVYMPSILTSFLTVLESDKSIKKQSSIRILKCLVIFGANLENYSHLILPTIIRIAEFSSGTLKRMAIVTIGKLAKTIDISEFSSRIVQSLIRSLNTGEKEVNKAIMNTLCLLLLQMNTDFIIYIPILNKTLVRNRVQHSVYDQLTNRLLNNEGLPSSIIFDKEADIEENDLSDKYGEMKKLPINQEVLCATWDCTQVRTQEDWQEWFRRLSIQLLRESPSQSIRACSNLISISYPLAKELFNISFSSCWRELSTENQDSLVQSLCSALSAAATPPEINQTLLKLIEYMDHDDNALPIPIHKLGEYAQNCNAYAKALRYKEMEYQQGSDDSIIESLININNRLHQTDAAIGILKEAQKNHDLQLKETWYEKLERWEDALNSYNEREAAGEKSPEIIAGKVKSLYALGEWDRLSEIVTTRWNDSSNELRQQIAPLAAGTAWVLGHWDSINKYVDVLTPLSQNREFFETVISIHETDFSDATERFTNLRNLLITNLSGLTNESYSRTYNIIVKAQVISELEEIVKYKSLPYNSEKRKVMKDTWNKRILGIQRNVDIWHGVLLVRSLVSEPKDDLDIWIEFANLCRKSNRMGLAKKVLNSLMEDGLDPAHKNSALAPPSVIYAHLKYLWTYGSQAEALDRLTQFTSRLVFDLGLDSQHVIVPNISGKSKFCPSKVNEYSDLLSKCFVKQGEWMVALDPNWRIKNPDTILSSYLLATHFNKSSYKAWHKWALANFEVISITLSNSKEKSLPLSGAHGMNSSSLNNEYKEELIKRHVVPAIKGFFHSIALSESSSLQDALRLLTLWFTFGGIPHATQAMSQGFSLIQLGTWLEVLPQLISHIHQSDQIVSRSLLSLLSELGKAHPQAVVYPLTVAIKSESVSRRKAAQSIIDKMRVHSAQLVEQAELVSHELIRVAVSWHEQWYGGLEDASREFFGEQNIGKTFAILQPLHEMIKKGPETLRETSFLNSFGRDLNIAEEWMDNYKKTEDVSNLNQAWDIYYSIFRKISKLLPQLQTLELQHVSPKLLAAKDFQLVIPGTYAVGKELVTISRFEPKFTVISSKQRPRKFTIKGSDGKNYQYALKGHEDIRQDSLVMQLFGLVNTLLQGDTESFRRHLDIQQFPAIPLSPRSGLLGWVSNSDTFHVLIKEHRDANKVPLNIEHWVMLQMAPDYDNLALLQKIEVFQYSMENTKGDDLSQVLWLRSKSSESWLERRTTYTRSLAVMSMVGYILGLGDRHPSNLMLDRTTGKVVHIDFGDCFETTILREKFPEKVPFRLTRMLREAMEVSGIEGSFRITCEHVMRVLRENKESLMAILEAFAFDPLIYWGIDLPTEKMMEEIGVDHQPINPNDLIKSGAISSEEALDLEELREQDIRNARAALVLKRIDNKLVGNDFAGYEELDVPKQVDKLIQQAVSIENLCQHYIGWCPFW
ncbi:phosphatidylinositol kinase family protein KNAG_0G00270 [Huiozyma naganishii CBS 8797]|uniref:Serine/threonine-protein kinase TOR n=1 Tax=Huiozyma naganishii (strain ATCC MYA-139 / BCRC 22969 / CBS 8797 / KCTC 17520 / NBRC 10181 / NCYC 3082 / Yp74L-3) TaxID=1071383 RepID=J7R898_HUIN7|nr:hypothetical protein KNAG_0G00270 [Kazachstania naganishii CBS 8797]CCK71085.1 hypothetical protein KNAG_0G00270 [Kazachstania naganishii CBS 8797]